MIDKFKRLYEAVQKYLETEIDSVEYGGALESLESIYCDIDFSEFKKPFRVFEIVSPIEAKLVKDFQTKKECHSFIYEDSAYHPHSYVIEVLGIDGNWYKIK